MVAVSIQMMKVVTKVVRNKVCHVMIAVSIQTMKVAKVVKN